MPAFEAALQAGADGVEFDVQRTVDGQLVVIHDVDVSRTTNGEGIWLLKKSLRENQGMVLRRL
jgi:glycerophosphoryl diester phosphodiesterase